MKTLKRLENNNNQIVICERISSAIYEYEFYSYGTLIAIYRTIREISEDNKDTLQLTEYYDYSRTTSKYLKIFLQQYCGIWYEDKKDLTKMIKDGGIGNVSIEVIKHY